MNEEEENINLINNNLRSMSTNIDINNNNHTTNTTNTTIISNNNNRINEPSLLPLLGGNLKLCKFKTLRFLLSLSGLRYHNISYLLSLFLTLAALIMFIAYLYRSFMDKAIDWSLLCHLTFTIHGATVYSLLSQNNYNKLDIFSVMGKISHPIQNSLCKKVSESSVFTISTNLEFSSKITSLLVLLFAFINFIAVWVEIGNPIAIVLGIKHTIPLKILSLTSWFFYSFGWFIPIAIVCPPTSYLLQLILKFETYIENHLSDNCDIELLMHWYNELFDYNVVLQKAFSCLVTLTIVIGSIFQIVLIMELFVVEMDKIGIISRIIWASANAIYVISVASTVAFLDSVNKRILTTVGRKCLYISCTPEMIKYQHFFTQIQSLPFGITFYGTRSFITFAAIFKVTSLIASVLVFLLGWSASNSKK